MKDAPNPDDLPSPQPSADLPSYAIEEDEKNGWGRWLRGRRLVLTLTATVLVLFAVFGIRPLYHEAKARRALALAAQGGEALDRGDSAEAARLLRQAALMSFQDPRVAALVTLHAARSGDMASVSELGKKLSQGQATPEETLVFGEMSLRGQRDADAARAADALKNDLSPRQNARAAVLRGGILQSRGQTNEAVEVLRAGLAADHGATADDLRLGLAKLLLSVQTPEAHTEAEQLLEQASANTGHQGADALRLLCISRAGITPEARSNFEKTAERLRAHAGASEEDEILLARIAASADPSRLGDIANDLVKRLQSDQNATLETRATAARWLVSQSRFKEALELVSNEDAGSHSNALMARLDALSGLEDWEQTSALLEKNRSGTLPDTLYRLFRARLAAVRGNQEASENEKRQLRQAMAFAELPHVLFAARYAESVGWKPEALAAWRVLASDEGARAEAIKGQLRNLAPNTPASEGLALAGQLANLQPQDPSALLSLAYFQLLANQGTAEAADLAEKFLAANPDSPDMRRVAALGRLRSGRAAEGLAIWPGDNDENRWRALHVALLREAGKPQEAKIAAESIHLDALGPEERDLVWEREGAADEKKSAP